MDSSFSISATPSLPQGLLDDVLSAGYLPNIVVNMMRIAVAGEPVTHHIVLPETSVSHHGVHSHLTVVVLTSTRLVMGHVDDYEGESDQSPVATSRTDSVRLDDIRNVSISQVFAEPTKASSDHLPNEITVTLSWGNTRRTEIEPTICGDSACTSEHGFTAMGMCEDLAMTCNLTQDGVGKLMQLMKFATAVASVTYSGPR